MGKLQPTFSIITVTFNAEKFLERTILSVLAQTYPRIEYILVDGASKDGTLAIVENYAPRIDKWVSEPDAGLYDAMNKGMKMASGDYICFLSLKLCKKWLIPSNLNQNFLMYYMDIQLWWTNWGISNVCVD